MFAALGHPSFRLVWISALLAQVGHWTLTVTFQWVVADDTHGDPTALGVLYFCSFAPFLLVSLHAGVLADSHNRLTSLIVIRMGAVAVSLVCTACSVFNLIELPLALALSLIAGGLAAAAAPLSQVLAVNVVGPDLTHRAVASLAVGLNLARVAGPALGGMVIIAKGSAAAFAASAAVSLLALYTLTLLPRDNSFVPLEGLEPVRLRIKHGIAYARARPEAWSSLILVGATSVFGSSWSALIPALALRLPGDAEQTFVNLTVICGTGSFVGVLWTVVASKPPSVRASATQLVALSGLLVVIGNVDEEWAILGAAGVCSALCFAVLTGLNSLLQQVAEEHQRGRIMSLYFICWGGMLPFGGLGISSLATVVGIPWAFAISGFLAALVGMWIRLRGVGVK